MYPIFTSIVSSLVCIVHCRSLFKIQLWGTLRGGQKVFIKHLYDDDYVEFDSWISRIKILHDYLFASNIYKISTIRTLAFKKEQLGKVEG